MAQGKAMIFAGRIFSKTVRYSKAAAIFQES